MFLETLLETLMSHKTLAQLSQKLDRFRHARAEVVRAFQTIETYNLSATTQVTAGRWLYLNLHGLMVRTQSLVHTSHRQVYATSCAYVHATSSTSTDMALL